MTRSRRDTNESDIVAFWRRMGCLWISQSREAGFDGLLIDCSNLYIVEIKQSGKRENLTPNERRTKGQIEAMGGVYNIITDLHEAGRLIGLEVE